MTVTDGPVPPDDLEPDSEFLPGIVRAVLPADRWQVTPRAFWCHVVPEDEPQLPAQGWKLHVSATPLAAPLVLHRCAEVLVAQRARFKFARTLGNATALVSGRYDRSGGGKFITVYPQDDEQFRHLAEQLHLATEGLPGPGILSDRVHRPGSLVHYRYGAFSRSVRLNTDGSWEAVLTTPDGGLEKDGRQPRYSPPSWARCPLPAPVPVAAAGSGSGSAAPSAVLLNDRYVVRRAVRHAYKGGVFIGTDQETGAEVIIKEARRHVGATLSGTDASTLLRHEARMHTALAPLGIAPALSTGSSRAATSTSSRSGSSAGPCTPGWPDGRTTRRARWSTSPGNWSTWCRRCTGPAWCCAISTPTT